MRSGEVESRLSLVSENASEGAGWDGWEDLPHQADL